MKKIYMILMAALSLTSCSDDFLDKEPKNTVDPETSVTTDVAVAMANACSAPFNRRTCTTSVSGHLTS